MKVDALVFDLGGVLIDIDLRRAFRACRDSPTSRCSQG